MTRPRRPKPADVAQLFTTPAGAPPAATPVVTAVAKVAPTLPVAIHEVLSFEARLISTLPAQVTLLLSDGTVITTSRVVYESTRKRGDVVFMGKELAAITLASEHDRASPAVWGQWRERKRDDRAWTLTAAEAVGSVVGTFTHQGSALGAVLRRYGVELADVGIDNEVPQPRANA